MRRIGVKARIGFVLVTAFLAVPLFAGQALAGAGKTTHIPAFYDGNQVTINIFELPPSETLLASNKSVNTIYATNDLDEEQDFAPVIDAIQGDGFNPLWHQVLIVFNAGIAPHQFVSEEDVLAAAAAGEITLVETDEVYLCAVVGAKA
jgi:hypothetical protein